MGVWCGHTDHQIKNKNEKSVVHTHTRMHASERRDNKTYNKNRQNSKSMLIYDWDIIFTFLNLHNMAHNIAERLLFTTAGQNKNMKNVVNCQ